MKSNLVLLSLLLAVSFASGQTTKRPAGTPYGHTTPSDVKQVMDRVLHYVDIATPVGIVDGITGKEITDLTKPAKEATLVHTVYNITSHEWGLSYSGMLMVSDATGDKKYKDYVSARFDFLGKASPYFRDHAKTFPDADHPMGHFLFPKSLDDTGSMCAAIIQALHHGIAPDLRAEVTKSIDFIMNKVYRLSDGTFARDRPMPNSVWVDDMYQGIPALAQYGKLTGDPQYFGEACRQVALFSALLFDKSKGACMHGWVEGMEPHPAFFWARANGWAVMAVASLLDVLPSDHPQRNAVLTFFRDYCHGLAMMQSSTGLWHQLLDRNDSFLETSASAMFTYVMAHGINQGWLDIRAYGPVALMGWNAVSMNVNDQGLVEGTCAGTSMAFDAAFYYQRPLGTGPHGYGSVLIAGAAMYQLLQQHDYDGNGPLIFRK